MLSSHPKAWNVLLFSVWYILLQTIHNYFSNNWELCSKCASSEKSDHTSLSLVNFPALTLYHFLPRLFSTHLFLIWILHRNIISKKAGTADLWGTYPQNLVQKRCSVYLEKFTKRCYGFNVSSKKQIIPKTTVLNSETQREVSLHQVCIHANSRTWVSYKKAYSPLNLLL